MPVSLRKLSPFSHGNISVIWAAFILSCFLLIYLTGRFQRSLRSVLEWWDLAVLAMAVYSLWTAYWFRRKWPTHVGKSRRVRLTPEKRWFTIQLVSLAAAQSIVLWGFFARIGLRSPAWITYLLYGIGILHLLIFEPSDRPPSIT